MATYFGEVLPEISRAVDDEEEILDCKRPTCEVIIRWSNLTENEVTKNSQPQIDCNLLIFCTNSNVSAFIRESFLPEDECPVGLISCGLDNKSAKNSLSQVQMNDGSCFIHKLPCNNARVLSVLWQNLFQLESMFFAVNKLFKCFQANGLKVLILSTAPTSDYTSGDSNVKDDSFVRTLKTDVYKDSVLSPSLEVPNTITGLPAYVLTHCQAHDIPAVLYVTYQDLMEKSNFDTFREILKSFNIPHNNSKNQSTIYQSHDQKSSCYI